MDSKTKIKLLLAMTFVLVLIGTLFFRDSTQTSNSENVVKVSDKSKKNYADFDPAEQVSQDQRDIELAKANAKKEKAKIDEEAKAFEDQFSRVDRMWSKAVQYKFKKLGISESAFEQYQQMRQDFEQEALSGLEKFHQDMKSKKGEDYTYRITEFDDKVMNELRKKYHDRLANIIGEEAMKEFVLMRDQFNEKLMRSQKGVAEDYTIDF